MTNKRLGYAFLVMGALVIAVALLAEVVGIGKPGLQAVQISVILAGIFVGLIGWGLHNLPENGKSWWERIVAQFESILNLPVLAWVLAGFLIVFALYFVRPMFFDAGQRLSYFTHYLPDLDPIGNDLNYNSSAISLWLQGHSPYEKDYHFYPPLYHVIFAPLVLLGPREKYALMTGLTLIAFGVLFILPWRKQVGSHGLFLFFFLTGLVSYGMQFELERGQFNLLALLLALIGVWLYHRLPSFRLLACTLVTIAAHLKLYPGIFVLMFFRRWNNWKEYLTTLLQFGILNIAAFLVLGYQNLIRFITAMRDQSVQLLWLLPDKQPINHSIRAFLDKLSKNNDHEVSTAIAQWISRSSAWLEVVLLAIVIICSLVILWRMLKNRSNLLHSDAVALFILLGLLLPSVSLDYKLVLLAPALAIFFANRTLPEKGWQKAIFAGLTVLMSVAYSLTLVPYQYRAGLLITAFPMLLIILLCLTGLNLLNNTWKEAL